MNNVKEIAEKHLDAKLKDLGVNIPNYRHVAINIMLKFGHQIAELQKQECYNNVQVSRDEYDSFEVDKSSILNCKNVCDE